MRSQYIFSVVIVMVLGLGAIVNCAKADDIGLARNPAWGEQHFDQSVAQGGQTVLS